MLAESVALGTSMMLPVGTPSTLSSGLTGHEAASVADPKTTAIQAGATTTTTNTFPPPKTDKPRPHVCGTCSRSFARLEHLKRHERSHTKEKPFACPECTRCFARRDLLLRHQQKLHQSATASSRPRGGRRESASGAVGGASGRVRKNSMANAASGGSAGNMRPRANTISHVDGNALGLMSTTGVSGPRKLANSGSRHAHHASLSQLPRQSDLKVQGTSSVVGHHGTLQGLPRLETQGLLGGDMAGGLRTAPPLGGFPLHFETDGLYSGDAGSTINPAQLHLSDSPQSYAIGTPTSPYQSVYSGVPTSQSITEQEDAFHWFNSFDAHAPFANVQESAVAESSPSALSTTSQSAVSDVMLDGPNLLAPGSLPPWTQPSIMPPSQMIPSTFSLDLPNSNFADLISPIPPPPGTISPKCLHEQFGPHDPYFSGAPPVTLLGPHTVTGGTPNQHFHPPMVFNPGIRSVSSELVNGTGRQTAVISVCTESITEMTRQALINDLSRTSLFGQSPPRDPTQIDNSPLTSGTGTMDALGSVTLPSTQDLQRYVAAYIQFFHPHLPFLHFPTLFFDLSAYGDGDQIRIGGLDYSPLTESGAGCLLLAVAAIGALYELETGPSKQLFQAAKCLVDICLEGHFATDTLAADGHAKPGPVSSELDTPLSLIQALLLIVLYGYNAGDKAAADSANTQCTRLIELARMTELTSPASLDTFARYGNNLPTHSLGGLSANEDVPMGDVGITTYEFFGADTKPESPSDQFEWHCWKVGEERKRTLFAIFILSSLLVSTYNHAPALTNSEIKLDLPCDEDLWAAENAQAWYARGGAIMAGQTSLPFSVALGTLLSASHRQSQRQGMSHPHQSLGPSLPWEETTKSEIKPGTFGCLVLINALHNYIWETRQRHHGRQWTAQETEAMHAHIEPALKAWQAAWVSDPHRSLGRPNPFGKGPLSADSVPLSDLAYVRLYVDFGRSKEAFFERNFEAMAAVLTGRSEVIQHGECSPSSLSTTSDLPDSLKFGSSPGESPTTATSSPDLGAIKPPTAQPPLSMVSDDLPLPGQPSKRERYLRKAAYYAVDSLAMSDKVGVTFASFDSRELPLQSALCAFDCAQVLAEWVSVLQERIGQYLGVPMISGVDLDNARHLMLLEDEDCALLEKIAQIVQEAEVKMATEVPSGESMSLVTALGNLRATDHSYGSKILSVTAYMLDRAAVWPVTRLMAQCLNTQAAHLDYRTTQTMAPLA